jgi:hypothetical protein
MRRLPPLFASLLVVTLLFAACGDDDDAGTTPTATTAVAASPATTPAGSADATMTPDLATESSEAGEGAGDASPSSATSAGTASTEESSPATASIEPMLIDSTATPLTGDDQEPTATVSAEDAPLLGVLLTAADLPDGWERDDASGPVDADNTDGEELCGTEGFPDEAQSTGQVTAQFFNEPAMIVMLQKVWAFPDDVAGDAFSFWKDATGCGQWTEDDGTTFTVEQLDDPGIGDESFAVHVTVDAAEDGLAQGDYVFVRSGSLLMLVAYIGTNDADFSPLAGPIETATERLQEVSSELGGE